MTDHARAVAERYSKDSAAYARLWAPVLRPLAQPLLGAMPDDPARVLDVGTGTGMFVPDLVAKWPGAFVCGADLTREMLVLAPLRARCVADARRLPFADGSFDAVVTTFVFQHVPEPDAAFRSVRAVIRDGGAFGIVTWHGPIPSYQALDVLNEMLDEHGAAPEHALARTGSVEDPEPLTALLTDAGFTIERRWLDETIYEMTQSSFLERMTTLGVTRRRMDTLHDVPGFLAALTDRLSTLPANAFHEPLGLIYTVARPA